MNASDSYHPRVDLNVCNVNDCVSMILASQEDFFDMCTKNLRTITNHGVIVLNIT